jgi:hypothetical protein
MPDICGLVLILVQGLYGAGNSLNALGYVCAIFTLRYLSIRTRTVRSLTRGKKCFMQNCSYSPLYWSIVKRVTPHGGTHAFSLYDSWKFKVSVPLERHLAPTCHLPSTVTRDLLSGATQHEFNAINACYGSGMRLRHDELQILPSVR